MLAPDKIYLQVDPEGESAYDSKEEFVEGVTWCQDKINDNDVEYIRTDLINAIPISEAPDTKLARENCHNILKMAMHTCPKCGHESR